MASAKNLTPIPAMVKVAFDRKRVYELSKMLADDNRFYFECISSSQFRHRFAIACQKMSENLSALEPIGDLFSTQMSKFDFDETCPGNGYRSVAAVLDSCILNSIRLLKEIKELRDTVLFRANHFSKELEAYGAVLDALRRDLECVKDYIHLWSPGELFPSEVANVKLKALMSLIESFDHSCFYGRCMGFQYCSSLFRVFQVIGISLASYSMLWETGNRETWTSTASAFFRTGRFLLNPEDRAKRISDVITNADISFCKSFWGLTESPLLQDLPKWFCPQLALNEVWIIPCLENIYLDSTTGTQLKITPPTAHTGPRPLPLRVMSLKPREGMCQPSKTPIVKNVIDGLAPKSSSLLFHCHGGGFVATSSKTHEVYLRHWAKLLNCTVVSVDYSLAPENPYPRAIEETLYAYAWVLSNADRLGWTGERICFVGDSAGGHLLMAATLRAIQMNVRRLPDGLVLVYSPFLIEYNPSPSRLLSFLDPLLPPGIMARCIAAYMGEKEPTTNTLNQNSPTKVSPTHQNRTTLTDYAANLKKENREGNHSNQTSPTSPNGNKTHAKKNDEIINFCMINKPSPSPPATTNGPAENVHFTMNGEHRSRAAGDDDDDDNDNRDDDDSSNESYHDATQIQVESPSGRINKLRCSRQRSRSDPTNESSMDDKTVPSSPETDDGSTDLSVETATVQIQKDPRRIVLSSSVYDQNFIDYLSGHELTRKSLVQLKAPHKALKKQTTIGSSLETSSTSSSSSTEGPSSAKLPRVDHLGNVSGHVRSYSTGSLSSMSQSIGSNLASVTGYAIDALSSFLDTPASASTESTTGSLSTNSNASTVSTPSRLSQFHNLNVPKDPFLSPLHADDEILSKIPPVSLIACHLDPLLDDSIAFAKRLRHNDVKVSLDLLDSLPHGFLNFTLYSADCRAGAKLCLKRIKEKLNVKSEEVCDKD